MSKNKKYIRTISIKCDERMCKMIDELEDDLMINTSSIIRIALVNFYKMQKNNTQ